MRRRRRYRRTTQRRSRISSRGSRFGFGAMGATAAIAIPLLAFYFPLGGGIASAKF